MTHPRVAIRAAVAIALSNAAIVAPGNVFTEKTTSLDDDDLPAINVITLPEQSTPADLTGKTLIRTLSLTVELLSTSIVDTDTPDLVDSLCQQVEDALALDQTFSGTVLESWLTGTDVTIDSKGQRPVGRMTMKYTAKYIA